MALYIEQVVVPQKVIAFLMCNFLGSQETDMRNTISLYVRIVLIETEPISLAASSLLACCKIMGIIAPNKVIVKGIEISLKQILFAVFACSAVRRDTETKTKIVNSEIVLILFLLNDRLLRPICELGLGP